MRTFAKITMATLLAGTACVAHASQPVAEPATPAATAPAAAVAADAPAPQDTTPQPATTSSDPVAPAEDDTTVVVTGNRSPKAVDKIAGAVTVVSQAEVSRSLALTEDTTAVLARTVPGYSESSQTLNTLGETMRGRTALYLFDGIPQSTPLRDGSRNAAFTDMSVVERIEVIGGASASEGIGAAGGVVNYISRRATQDGWHFNVGGRLGSQFRDDSTIWGVKGTLGYRGGGMDVFAAGGYVDRGITYDARGRRIGLSASSSLADSRQYNAFLKVGGDLGSGGTQRLESTFSYFRLEGKNNYHYVAGNRALGIPDTAEPGPQLVNGLNLLRPDFNQFFQTAVNYSNTDLAGGTLVTTLYFAKQQMRFPGDNGADRQDPLIAPLGTLVDQSEIRSFKYGLRTSYSHKDFLVPGLELRFGLDAVHDQTEQRLALTNRVWVPPLKYTSYGPYVQLSWDIGPITLSGGVRYESGKVKVNDYTTTYFRNRVSVRGGTLDYTNTLPNAGIIARLGGGFSVFGTYSKGFTLPNVGIPLRNVNYTGQSVEGILDLKAVIFDNKEFGANWRSSWGSLGASYYNSFSKLGSSLGIDPVTLDFVLVRRPVRIQGIDVTGDLRPTSWLRINGVYSHLQGRTTAANNVETPVATPLGITNIPLDKLNLTATVKPTDALSFSVGMDNTFSRTQTGSSPPENIRGRTLIDATVNYRIAHVGTVSLAAENLFNKYYFLAFSQIDFFQNYFAGRGRTVTLSLRSDF